MATKGAWWKVIVLGWLVLSLMGCRGKNKLLGDITQHLESSQEAYVSSHLIEYKVLINSIDQAQIVFVPAGEFIMGPIPTNADEDPAQIVYLDAFWIYKLEVTNEQIAEFLNQYGNLIPGEGKVQVIPPSDGFLPIFKKGGIWQPAEGYANHPAQNVSYYGAQAYCEWIGGRLPTFEEWEKAARGTDGRRYPWGENADCSRGKFKGCSNKTTSPVGSFPRGASPYGALDMAGNVWEWVNSFWEEEDGDRRYPMSRGGSYEVLPINQTTFLYSIYYGPGNAYGHIGFRCVIDKPQR